MAEKKKTCYRCGFIGETTTDLCPQCKAVLQTTSSVRIRGGLLAAIGISLTGSVAYLLFWALAAFENTDPSGTRFTGTEQEKVMIIGLFSALILFGFVALVTGAWHLAFGRRNRMLSWAVVAVGILLAVGTGVIIWRF